jgi:hypothetical protein
VGQMVKCLSSKHEALNSSPSDAKKEEEKRNLKAFRFPFKKIYTSYTNIKNIYFPTCYIFVSFGILKLGKIFSFSIKQNS